MNDNRDLAGAVRRGLQAAGLDGDLLEEMTTGVCQELAATFGVVLGDTWVDPNRTWSNAVDPASYRAGYLAAVNDLRALRHCDYVVPGLHGPHVWRMGPQMEAKWCPGDDDA